MKPVHALVHGWHYLNKLGRAWFIIYGCNLLLALVAVIPVRSWIKGSAGRSMLLEQSAGAFDFTFISDLLRNCGQGSSALWIGIGVVVILYLVLTAFLTGGFLSLLTGGGAFNKTQFVLGGMQYFWRLLRMALYFLGIHLALLTVAVMILMSIGINPMQMENDVRFMRIAQWIFVGYGVAFFLVLLIYTYAKIDMVAQSRKNVVRSIRHGFAFVKRHFIKALGLYILNGLVLLIIFALYRWLKYLLPSVTWPGIVIGFVLSQLWVFARVGVRLLVLSSGYALWRTGEDGARVR